MDIDLNAYPFEVRPLSAGDGGGYLITYPDFNACLSDGETVAEAVSNGQDALNEAIAVLLEYNLVPYTEFELISPMLKAAELQENIPF